LDQGWEVRNQRKTFIGVNEGIMKVKSKIFFSVLAFLGLLIYPGYPAAESGKTSGNVLGKQILQTATVPGRVPGKERFNLVSISAFTVGGETIGSVARYDDPATERPADYLELYDQGGDLLAVGWFDQFGIERTAVDRGLVENADKPEGVFVVLLDGDFI
jgi:hypothetical protein